MTENYNQTKKNIALKILHENIMSIRPFEVLSENYQFKPDIQVENEKGQLCKLTRLIKEQTLVFCFNETHCSSCIDMHLLLLKNLIKTKKIKRLVVLSSNMNSRKIKVLKNANKLNFSIYNIKDDIGIPMENISVPYFFIVEKDLSCKNFLGALKEAPEITTNYIESIKL